MGDGGTKDHQQYEREGKLQFHSHLMLMAPGSGSLLEPDACLQLEGSFIYRGLTVYTLQN